MNWDTIIIIVCISALVASLITMLGNWYVNQMDFFNNYNKYILEKRKNAYTYLEPIIKRFNEVKYFVVNDEVIKKYRIQIYEKGQISYNQRLLEDLSKYYQHKVWYSKELNSYLNELYSILTMIETQKKDNHSLFVVCEVPNLSESIEKLSIEISKYYYNDLMKLKKLEIFKDIKFNQQTN